MMSTEHRGLRSLINFIHIEVVPVLYIRFLVNFFSMIAAKTITKAFEYLYYR